MTTLEEISICPKANRLFWSGCARLSIASYRYNGASPADRRLARAAFRKHMADRRAQTYLDAPLGQLDMFGEAA